MWSKERFSIIKTTMRLKGVGNEASSEVGDSGLVGQLEKLRVQERADRLLFRGPTVRELLQRLREIQFKESVGILPAKRNIFSLVVVNFASQRQSTSFTFPISGGYTEQVEGTQDLVGVVAGVPIRLPIWSTTPD
jgi:hypothetical protein